MIGSEELATRIASNEDLLRIGKVEFGWKGFGFRPTTNGKSEQFVRYCCLTGSCSGDFKDSPEHLVDILADHARRHESGEVGE